VTITTTMTITTNNTTITTREISACAAGSGAVEENGDNA